MASPGSLQGMMMSGPPYRPMIWASGGLPDKNIDIPVTATFLALFVLGAATHMTIFQLNRRRGHKFLFNLFLFAFCMARVATTTLRIASVSLPTNINLAIAAQIFVAAGILIVFIINLIWSQRILRSLHQNFGWHSAISILFKLLYVLIILTLAIVITATVQMFFTLRPRTRTIDRALQLYAATFLAVVSFLPIPIVLLALLIPRKSAHDKFGYGRLRTKIFILLTGTTLCCLGAAFRCGTSWKTPVPLTQPRPYYFSKTFFYVFNFVVEVLVVYLYAISRVDLRFHIPNGAKGPGGYAAMVTSSSEHGDAESRRQEDVESNVHEKKSEERERGRQKSSSQESRPRSKSEEARIITRLGGPWKKISSPGSKQPGK